MSLDLILSIIGLFVGIVIFYPMYRLFSSQSKKTSLSFLFTFLFSAITVSCFHFIALSVILSDVRYFVIAVCWFISQPLVIQINHKKGRTYIEGAQRGFIVFIVLMIILTMFITFFSSFF